MANDENNNTALQAIENSKSIDPFGNNEEDGVLGLVPYGYHSDSDYSIDIPVKSKKRKKRVQVKHANWMSTQNKCRRESGKSYYGKKKENNVWCYKKKKDARAMKQRCKCKGETGKAAMQCAQITDDERGRQFKQFWSMNMKQKRIYVNTLIQSTIPVRRVKREEKEQPKRSQTLKYYLKIDNKNMRVCRTFFLNTLDIGRHTMLNMVKRPVTSNHKSNTIPMTEFSNERKCLNSFLDSLPVMESHYCRAGTQKKYLLPDWSSKRMIYNFYVKDWCPKHEMKHLSISVFYEAFDIKNYGLFSPKKDQCEICVRHSRDNIPHDQYALHQEKKIEARNEKQKDKAEERIVLTVDLQAVLMAPKSEVSSLYYRTKLQVHNLVFYNLINHKAYCFIWNEVEGGVSAEEFASIWVYFIQHKILPHLSDNEIPAKIIFYSDGCSYQNRNVTMSNALLNAAVKYQITIEQKILETGHTQMEADSVHSLIERALKHRTIDVPAEYIAICKNARKNPEPYEVEYLDHTFFKTFRDLKFVKSIRPGREKGDTKVTDIRAIKYTAEKEMFYKLRFPNSWQTHPQRINKTISPLDWSDLPQLHSERKKITTRKYEDLQYLKMTLPKDHHQFYDELPHE